MLISQEFEVGIFGNHGIYIPDAIAQPFIDAGHKRVRVVARFQGKEIQFHAALLKHQDQFVMSFGKRYQKELGVVLTDFFALQLYEDNSKYGVEMPEEFQAVLDSDPEAMEFFHKLTPGKQRNMIYYVLRVKNSQKRIDKALIITENLKMGITDPRELIKDRR